MKDNSKEELSLFICIYDLCANLDEAETQRVWKRVRATRNSYTYYIPIFKDEIPSKYMNICIEAILKLSSNLYLLDLREVKIIPTILSSYIYPLMTCHRLNVPKIENEQT